MYIFVIGVSQQYNINSKTAIFMKNKDFYISGAGCRISDLVQYKRNEEAYKT